jgi:hypothetical protein
VPAASAENNIGDGGAHEFQTALHDNSTLTALELHCAPRRRARVVERASVSAA